MASADHIERHAKALEMRLAGATYDAIAKALGYAGPSGAFSAVQEGLATTKRPDDDATTLTELARLDAMLTGLWAKARRGEVTAVDRVMRIEERREQVIARQTAHAEETPPSATTERTGLSEFERRLRERESGPDAPRRSAT